MRIKAKTISIFFLWIIAFIIESMVIKTDILEFAIIIILFVLIILTGNVRLQFGRRNLIICYALLLFLLIPDIVSGNIAEGFRYIFPFIFRLIIYMLAYSCIASEGIKESYIKIPVIIGFLLSFGSLLIKIGQKFGVPGYYTTVDRIGITLKGHFWGIPLGTFIDVWEGQSVSRMCGFFSEPTNYALFLEIGLILSWMIFFEKKSIGRFLTAVIITIGFIFTQSRAGYVSVVAGIVFLFFTKTGNTIMYNQKNNKFKRVLRLICLGFAGLAAGYFLMVLFNVMAQYFPDSPFLRAGIFNSKGNVTLFRPEQFNVNLIVQFIINKPFGYGISMVVKRDFIDINFASAINFWLIGAGVIGFVGILFFVGRQVIKNAFDCVLNRNKLIRGLGVILFVMTVHQCSDGTWFNGFYLLIIAMAENQGRINREEKPVLEDNKL